MRRLLTVLVALALVVALGAPAFGDNGRGPTSPDRPITAMDYHGHWHHRDYRGHGYYRHRYYYDGYYRHHYPYYYYGYPYYYDGYYARCRWAYYHDPYWFDRYCRGYYY